MFTEKKQQTSNTKDFHSFIGQVRDSVVFDIEVARDLISDQINNAMVKEKVSKAELARRLGKSRAYVTKILQGNVNFTIETLVRIGRALGYKYVPLFAQDEQWQTNGAYCLSTKVEDKIGKIVQNDSKNYELIELSNKDLINEEKRTIG